MKISRLSVKYQSSETELWRNSGNQLIVKQYPFLESDELPEIHCETNEVESIIRSSLIWYAEWRLKFVSNWQESSILTKFEWRKNGERLSETGSRLNATCSTNCTFQCSVGNTHKSLSPEVQLSKITAPRFQQPPIRNVSYSPGSDVKIECDVIAQVWPQLSYDGLTFKWRKDRKVLRQSTDKRILLIKNKGNLSQ